MIGSVEANGTGTKVVDPLDALSPWEKQLIVRAREMRRIAVEMRKPHGLVVTWDGTGLMGVGRVSPAGTTKD